MVEFEADDAIATAAARFAAAVDRVIIASPDKDFAQCVVGQHVILHDRVRRMTYDDAGVRTKFGVAPDAIPDLLALVGDSADGIPGIPGWGAKSAAAVCSPPTARSKPSPMIRTAGRSRSATATAWPPRWHCAGPMHSFTRPWRHSVATCLWSKISTICIGAASRGAVSKTSATDSAWSISSSGPQRGGLSRRSHLLPASARIH